MGHALTLTENKELFMSAIEVTTTKGQNSISVNYDFGDNLAEATKLFGEDVVFSGFRRNAVIALQGVIRPELEKGTADEAIRAKVAAWKPGVVTRSAADPVAAITAKWGALDAEKRKELLKKLREMA